MSNEVYWRVLYSKNERTEEDFSVATMQWFDEQGYDTERYVLPLKFKDKETAWEFCEALQGFPTKQEAELYLNGIRLGILSASEGVYEDQLNFDQDFKAQIKSKLP